MGEKGKAIIYFLKDSKRTDSSTDTTETNIQYLDDWSICGSKSLYFYDIA